MFLEDYAKGVEITCNCVVYALNYDGSNIIPNPILKKGWRLPFYKNISGVFPPAVTCLEHIDVYWVNQLEQGKWKYYY
jgi:hypothetical protein